MEHEVCSYHYILLDQGYVPVIFWRITRSTAIHGLWGAEERLWRIWMLMIGCKELIWTNKWPLANVKEKHKRGKGGGSLCLLILSSNPPWRASVFWSHNWRPNDNLYYLCCTCGWWHGKVLIGWRLLFCSCELSWESLWSVENIVVIFLILSVCSPIYVLLTFIF